MYTNTSYASLFGRSLTGISEIFLFDWKVESLIPNVNLLMFLLGILSDKTPLFYLGANMPNVGLLNMVGLCSGKLLREDKEFEA